MATFLATNPGLESRFSTTVEFDDYTDAELRDIFARAAAKADFEPTPECLARFEELASLQIRDEGFGNGRYAATCWTRRSPGTPGGCGTLSNRRWTSCG